MEQENNFCNYTVQGYSGDTSTSQIKYWKYFLQAVWHLKCFHCNSNINFISERLTFRNNNFHALNLLTSCIMSMKTLRKWNKELEMFEHFLDLRKLLFYYKTLIWFQVYNISSFLSSIGTFWHSEGRMTFIDSIFMWDWNLEVLRLHLLSTAFFEPINYTEDKLLVALNTSEIYQGFVLFNF